MKLEYIFPGKNWTEQMSVIKECLHAAKHFREIESLKMTIPFSILIKAKTERFVGLHNGYSDVIHRVKGGLVWFGSLPGEEKGLSV